MNSSASRKMKLPKRLGTYSHKPYTCGTLKICPPFSGKARSLHERRHPNSKPKAKMRTRMTKRLTRSPWRLTQRQFPSTVSELAFTSSTSVTITRWIFFWGSIESRDCAFGYLNFNLSFVISLCVSTYMYGFDYSRSTLTATFGLRIELRM